MEKLYDCNSEFSFSPKLEISFIFSLPNTSFILFLASSSEILFPVNPLGSVDVKCSEKAPSYINPEYS